MHTRRTCIPTSTKVTRQNKPSTGSTHQSLLFVTWNNRLKTAEQ